MYLHKKDPDEGLERWAQGLKVTAAFAENPSSVLSVWLFLRGHLGDPSNGF